MHISLVKVVVIAHNTQSFLRQFLTTTTLHYYCVRSAHSQPPSNYAYIASVWGERGEGLSNFLYSTYGRQLLARQHV